MTDVSAIYELRELQKELKKLNEKIDELPKKIMEAYLEMMEESENEIILDFEDLDDE